jgi:ABC-type antimicrobial peptide transport system permease subunit
MDEVVSQAVAPRRMNTVLIAVFAGLALVLSALGVYAVVAYGVAQRAREFGIRNALGATSRDLIALASRELAVVGAAGLALGLAGAWASARVLANQVYGVEVHDAVTFAVVPLVLLVPGVLATLIPAWRAARVNACDVMRAD